MNERTAAVTGKALERYFADIQQRAEIRRLQAEDRRLKHLLAVSIDPSQDQDHEWCDEDGGGQHSFDRPSFEADVRAALGPKP